MTYQQIHSCVDGNPGITVHPYLPKPSAEGYPGSWPKGSGIPGNPPWATEGSFELCLVMSKAAVDEHVPY